MLLFDKILFLILCGASVAYIPPYSNVGTCLFRHKQNDSRCWTSTELAKLRARQVFEQIIPPQPPPDKINTKYVKNTIKYFRRALREVKKHKNSEAREILRDALADTIGAHLRVRILPAVRLSYYAGYVRYRDVRRLHDLHDELKYMLNTQGFGWKQPARTPEWSNLTVAKLMIGSGRIFKPCRFLNVHTDSNCCFHLPEPLLDDNDKPSAIALPFKHFRLFGLTSPLSENILIKYYLTAARCILHSSPPKCRHTDFVNFNNEVWHWMKRDVAPHLIDEKLYSAFGGVLRVAAAVQCYGKDLKRRYLEYTTPEDDDEGIKQPNLWDKLTEPSIVVNSQWDAKYYIAIVIVAAVAICLLQICYNYVFGDVLSCQCSGYKSQKGDHKYVYGNDSAAALAAVEAAALAVVEVAPQHPLVDYERKPPSIRSAPTKRSGTRDSVRSTRTQKVFDLNENTEKMMAIAMSEYEKQDSDTSRVSANSYTDSPSPTVRSNSPPMLETPISQLKISRTSVSKSRSCMPGSASICTSSDVTFKRATSTTGSETSSTMSATSMTSKSHSRITKSSRDMPWARRMFTRKALKCVKKARVKSCTEDLTFTSCTTSRSRQ